MGGRLVDDPADDTERREHGHVPAHAVGGAFVDRHRPERRRRVCRDHARRHRRRQLGALQLQQLFELLGPTGLRVGVLELDAHPVELELQGVGTGAVPLERDVVAPRAAHALRDPRRERLHARQGPEDRRLKHARALLRAHLRRDEQQMAEQRRHQQVAGALLELEDGTAFVGQHSQVTDGLGLLGPWVFVAAIRR